MNPRLKFKTRPPITEAKETVINFFKNQRILSVSTLDSNNTLVIDSIDFFYFNNRHIAVLSPMSKIKTIINESGTFVSFVQTGVGKEAQKLYATFNYQEVDTNSEIILELEQENTMIRKMRSHNAKFLELTIAQATIILSDQEIYDLDNNLNPSFAKYHPNGRERFENSRKILMEYLDREVIFNCITDGNMYYTLTKASSNKIQYINTGGTCRIYDGKDCIFNTVIKVLPEKTDEIFKKLTETNNMYFKENIDLVALCFEKI